LPWRYAILNTMPKKRITSIFKRYDNCHCPWKKKKNSLTKGTKLSRRKLLADVHQFSFCKNQKKKAHYLFLSVKQILAQSKFNWPYLNLKKKN
jgi:hypothetical protein